MAMNWTKQQQEVIDSRDCSILVSAAAGSGKTAVLSQRILSLITDPDHPLDIDRLLVVTFTNAAASEMRERIRRNLEKELEENPDDLHLQRQISLVHNASITTIDSFCLQVVRSHFYLTDLDPGFRVADPGELDLLRADVCDAVLNEFYEEGSTGFLEFARNYSSAKSDAPLEEMIGKLYDYSQSYPWPEEWLASSMDAWRISDEKSPEEQGWCQVLTGFYRNCICDMERQLENLRELTALPEGPVKYQEALEADLLQVRALKACRTLADWQKKMEHLSFQKLKSVRKSEGDDALRETVKEGRNALKKELQSWQKKYFSQDMETARERMKETGRMAAELIRLTQAFSAHYRQEKKKRNIIDFSDCEHLALQILIDPETKKPTDAAAEYRRQFAEVMVDEYQDSNFVQEEILTAVSGIAENRDNYFTVGDVKQSIYRFRLARPELFMEKYHTYQTGGLRKRRIDLHQNFRSRTEVIDFVNQLFEKTMQKDIGNVEYDADAALYPGGDFSGDPVADYQPEILLCDDSADAGGARQREAELIAQRIRQMTDHDEIPGISYRDMVILMRSPSRCADIYQEVLSSYGIPVHVQSQTGYFSALEVRLVLEMLRLIDNPLQDIPLASVMHSFFGKFTAEEMAEIKADFPQLRFYEAVPAYAGKEETTPLVFKVRDFLSMIEEFRELVPYTPIHSLLEEIFRRTGFYTYAQALPSGKQRRANLDMLMQRAIDYEKTSYRGLMHFNRYIELLRKYDVDYGEADVISESDNAVRLMSIHKSKGLEFPVVFLADAGGRFNVSDENSNLVFHPDYGFGLKYFSKEKHIRSDTLIRQAFALQAREESLGEELRVLYVALTRAEKKLMITGSCKKERLTDKLSEGENVLSFFRRFHASSYLDFILPASADEETCKRKWFSQEDIEKERRKLSGQVSSEKQETVREAYDRDPDAERKTEALFSWNYPYEGEALPAQKLTVTELKERAVEQGAALLSDQEEQRLIREEVPSPYVPGFISEKQTESSGAGYGTAMHRFLRYMDILHLPEKPDRPEAAAFVREQIERMVREGKLTQQTAKQLNQKALTDYLQSAVARRIAEAAGRGELFREQPFMMAVDARTAWPEAPAGETILVQGIIDIFWIEEDGIVLMDYKTDRVREPQALRERYSVQIHLYRKALAQFYPELPVKEAYIYSLYLGKLIPV